MHASHDFVHDEAQAVPPDAIAPDTAFADIAPQWRCPDCGSDKDKFRPYGND
ncbi:MAG: rubredoxin [Steroidobacter sp.]